MCDCLVSTGQIVGQFASHRKLLQSRFQTRRRREQFMDKFTNNLLVPSTSNLALGLHNKKKQPEKKQSCDQTPSSSPSSSLSDCIETKPLTQQAGCSLEDWCEVFGCENGKRAECI